MNLLHFFADVFFPKQCYGCKQSNTYLCEQCTQTILEKNLEPQCPHCGIRTPSGVLRGSCYSALLVNQLFVATTYQNATLKKMFMDFKYHRAKALAESLARTLTQWIVYHNYQHIFQQHNTVVVPVPSHINRERSRGFHPATAVAQCVASAYQLPLATNIVHKHKNIGFQTHIKNAKQRRKNVEGCFALTPHAKDIKEKTVLLVDDVITTGSTMRECAKTLRTARPNQIIGLAVARQGLE